MDKELNIKGTSFRLKPDYPLLIFYSMWKLIIVKTSFKTTNSYERDKSFVLCVKQPLLKIK